MLVGYSQSLPLFQHLCDGPGAQHSFSNTGDPQNGPLGQKSFHPHLAKIAKYQETILWQGQTQVICNSPLSLDRDNPIKQEISTNHKAVFCHNWPMNERLTYECIRFQSTIKTLHTPRLPQIIYKTCLAAISPNYQQTRQIKFFLFLHSFPFCHGLHSHNSHFMKITFDRRRQCSAVQCALYCEYI